MISEWPLLFGGLGSGGAMATKPDKLRAEYQGPAAAPPELYASMAERDTRIKKEGRKPVQLATFVITPSAAKVKPATAIPLTAIIVRAKKARKAQGAEMGGMRAKGGTREPMPSRADIKAREKADPNASLRQLIRTLGL